MGRPCEQAVTNHQRVHMSIATRRIRDALRVAILYSSEKVGARACVSLTSFHAYHVLEPQPAPWWVQANPQFRRHCQHAAYNRGCLLRIIPNDSRTSRMSGGTKTAPCLSYGFQKSPHYALLYATLFGPSFLSPCELHVDPFF